MHQRIVAKILNLILIIAVLSCRTHKPVFDYELQQQIKEDYTADSTQTQVLITSTIPIDSVDPNKIIFDIYRIEIDEYPNNLKIYARVYDSLGNFVTNMAEPYLRNKNIKYWAKIEERLGEVLKKPAPIDSFVVREFGANDSIPYNIVLTVDYSGSMIAVMNALFEGTELFVSMKQSFDSIALSSFGTQFNLQVPFSADKDKILNLYRIKRKEGVGVFSAVFDAVWNCIELFDGTDEKIPRVLVVFSDGDDNYSKKEIGTLIEKAKEMNIHIFTIAFGYSEDRNLRYLAQYTGGKFYKAYTREELISIFRDIYLSLRNFYYITYKPPKFWGYHKVYIGLKHPQRSDTLYAEGEYNTANLYPWDSIGTVFERPIFFDFDKADLKPESYPIIDEVVDQMLSNPKLKLEIQGHTDNIGGVEYNLRLSERRAKAVMDAIIERGIDPKRLRSRGFGMSMPKVSNDTEEGRAINRRTEFHVLAK